MKKFFSLMAMLLCTVAMMAQAEIKFDKTVHNFGSFSVKSPVSPGPAPTR